MLNLSGDYVTFDISSNKKNQKVKIVGTHKQPYLEMCVKYWDMKIFNKHCIFMLNKNIKKILKH